MNFKKMLINFRKKVSGIIPFVYVGKEEIHKYMQYEITMTVCVGRIANQRKLQVRITKYLMCTYGGHMCIRGAFKKFVA